ncbi:branched-chain amino acid transport system II carrier protein [Liquorilactobacillus satsumensis]|uniref:Branched-chain amino acid transport system carrier protein n=1 Tax=Liquorilactobacillus satsumensis DSM 16230 = JCM 12392 TaxID=1423801 RepID=A0A0R1VEQ4_9LACO|nr:branched-chain amino acid transport system II carrier protein [Liquorilactobacillus satsumensis]KRM00316.1 LIVCS family cation symporter [Liquorilactobacillus satsumensis DSM 16230 = JCM 12392]MCC7667713.1 branched-chain amino acid transport system II carrier protein [Liquorilactobacillus satsumensis]MCP9313030.1 branched-chain amino acid transport system II carrier protein [Liquorilactobacillus satsumensis]MCP9328976.1 branched-chain amino acid transport system II carrier protein [Liquorila
MGNKELSKKQYLILASLLFGLFFGAGNLIFPIHLGQLAGKAWFFAAIGFLLSAILMPLLSLLAISLTKSNSMYDLALPAGKFFSLFFLILTHLSLGLLIAAPRTATVTFSLGVQPFLPQSWEKMGLLIFSFLFFGAVFLLAYKQSQITKYVGKLLNPLFVVLLAFIFLIAFLIKGDLQGIALGTTNKAPELINGFLQGYNTMDALAGLGFGVTIISALKLFGVKESKARARAVAKVGVITMGFEAIIYIFLIALGAASLSYTKLSSEGGTAFSEIMKHYTGMAGAALLAALTLLACLTTAIGLITSLSQDWGHRFPKLGYHFFLSGATLGSFMISNFGLTQIILYSSPILSFLYPLAIALIILGLLQPYIGKEKLIYKATILLTLIPAILDLIHNLPAPFLKLQFLHTIDIWASAHIPLYAVGLDFLPFMILGFFCGILLLRMTKGARTVAPDNESQP